MTYRCLSLYHMHDPRTLVLLSVRRDNTGANNVEVGQLFVGRCKAVTVFVQCGELDNHFDALLFVIVSVGIIGSGGFRVENRQSRTGYGLFSLILATNEGGKSLLLGSVGVICLVIRFLIFWLGVRDR